MIPEGLRDVIGKRLPVLVMLLHKLLQEVCITNPSEDIMKGTNEIG